MKLVNYRKGLDQMYQAMGFPLYRWSEFGSSPWASFEKPLGDTSLGLISSGGIFRDDQKPFDPWAVNDFSFRRIPIDTPFARLRVHDNYFDHRDTLRDFNCVFPIERLKDLEEEGYIGRFVQTAITLGMGRLYKRTGLEKQTVPRIVDVMREQGAEAILLVAA